MITRKTRDSATQTDSDYVKPQFRKERSQSFRNDRKKSIFEEKITQPCRLQLIESKIVSDSEEISEDNSSSRTKAQITTVEQSQVDESDVATYNMYEQSQPVNSISPSQSERRNNDA